MELFKSAVQSKKFKNANFSGRKLKITPKRDPRVGVCSSLLETRKLFITRICDFLYPRYDLKRSFSNSWDFQAIHLLRTIAKRQENTF